MSTDDRKPLGGIFSATPPVNSPQEPAGQTLTQQPPVYDIPDVTNFQYKVVKRSGVPVKIIIAKTAEAVNQYTRDPLASMIALPDGRYLVFVVPESLDTLIQTKKDLDDNQVKIAMVRKAFEELKTEWDKLYFENQDLKVKAKVLDTLEPILKNIFNLVPQKKIKKTKKRYKRKA